MHHYNYEQSFHSFRKFIFLFLIRYIFITPLSYIFLCSHFFFSIRKRLKTSSRNLESFLFKPEKFTTSHIPESFPVATEAVLTSLPR